MFEMRPRWVRTLHGRGCMGVAVCVAVLFESMSAAADSRPLVTTATSAAAVELGQPFYFYVRVSHLPGQAASIPVSLNLGDALVELGRSSKQSAGPDGRIERIFEVALAAFEVGEVEIPAVPVAMINGKEPHWTTPVKMQVVSIIGDSAPVMRKLDLPVVQLRRDYRLIYGSAGALFVVFLGGLVVARVRRERRAKRQVIARVLAPKRRAMDRLEQLEGGPEMESIDLRPAYVTLSEIIREFITLELHLGALDSTTKEIEVILQRAELAPVWLEIMSVLRDADMVKFAGSAPTFDVALESLYRVRRWIEQAQGTPGEDLT